MLHHAILSGLEEGVEVRDLVKTYPGQPSEGARPGPGFSSHVEFPSSDSFIGWAI